MASLSQLYNTKMPFGIKDTAFYIDALIVGGGGGTSTFTWGQIGKGGGRVVQAFNLLIEKNVTYNITVGGAGGSNTNGGDSVFGSLISQGGGTGNKTGGTGGGTETSASIQPLFPTVGTYSVNDVLNATNIISSGNAGGNSGNGPAAGGGGGAGSVGRNFAGGTGSGGIGGDGLLSIIKGPGPYYYGAGTGGSSIYVSSPASSGAGSGGLNSGTGGQSGVVVIAYRNTLPLATTTGSPNLYTSSPPSPLAPNPTRTGYHVYEFVGSGTIIFN
jgi:hypothetical protein